MKQIIKEYRQVINRHLELYETNIVKVMREYISKEYVTVFGPIKYDEASKDIPKWTAMANARIKFLLDWLIRNQIIACMYNTACKRIRFGPQDCDNAGMNIAPKDKIAKTLIYWYNVAMTDTSRMWNECTSEFLHVEEDMHIWYRKLCCVRVKRDAGCYADNEERGQAKWNRCENMLRIFYLILSLIVETRAFLTDIDKYLDKKSVKIKYTIDRELLFKYRDARRIYLDSNEDINEASRGLENEQYSMTETQKYTLCYLDDS